MTRVLIIEGRDIQVFSTLEKLCEYLEPWYIEEEEHYVFDLDGNEYHLKVHRDRVCLDKGPRPPKNHERVLEYLESHFEREIDGHIPDWLEEHKKTLPTLDYFRKLIREFRAEPNAS
ncbi:hypothetical protein [Mucisphaera sp.]|uniref:hypothetical protein n=1 Tax=Mucisphaera sp. TaxID=2913024 RepID=UPI003D1390C7